MSSQKDQEMVALPVGPDSTSEETVQQPTSRFSRKFVIGSVIAAACVIGSGIGLYTHINADSYTVSTVTETEYSGKFNHRATSTDLSWTITNTPADEPNDWRLHLELGKKRIDVHFDTSAGQLTIDGHGNSFTQEELTALREMQARTTADVAHYQDPRATQTDWNKMAVQRFVEYLSMAPPGHPIQTKTFDIKQNVSTQMKVVEDQASESEAGRNLLSWGRYEPFYTSYPEEGDGAWCIRSYYGQFLYAIFDIGEAGQSVAWRRQLGSSEFKTGSNSNNEDGGTSYLSGEGDCVGRCGAGCNNDFWYNNNYFYDCFEHDSCVGYMRDSGINSDEGVGAFADNCGDEFDHAADDYAVGLLYWGNDCA